MILRPGDLLGLPPGLPDPAHLPALRYLLVALAIGCGVAVWRGRPWMALAAGLVFFELAVGFWVFGLGRPYGLLVDPAATRRAAELAVAATGAAEGFVAGTAAPGWWSVRLAAAGAPAAWLLLGPTLLPLLVPALVALAIHVLARPRHEAALGALLWLALGTGALDVLVGLGFLTGLWSRPVPAMAVAALAVAVLALARHRRLARAWPVMALAVAAAAATMPASLTLSPAQAVRALTFDSWLWLLLGGYGLWLGTRAAARALAAGGALGVLLAGLLGVGDAWIGHACYRLGLVIAAAGPVAELAEALGRALVRAPRLAAEPPRRLGEGLVVAGAAALGFVAWWPAPALDPVAAASRAPVPAALVEAMAWVRRETAPEAVFMASPVHAPAVAALGARRVLRAPGLVTTPDDVDRWNLEDDLLQGHVPRRTFARYGVAHVFLAPGDFAERWLPGPETLDAAPHLRLRYRDAEGYRVYDVVNRQIIPVAEGVGP